MIARILSGEPDLCVVPTHDVETEVWRIRIVIEGLSGNVPTALIAQDLGDALAVRDKLDRRLGLGRDS